MAADEQSGRRRGLYQPWIACPEASEAARAWRERRQSARLQGQTLMVDFKADLSPGVSLPPGFKVDTTDPRYRALHDLAVREKLSQSAFSSILSVEAARINSEYERARSAAPAAPAPAPAPKVDYAKLSTTEKFQLALERSAAKRNGG
jgi:hypothetical protein